MNPEFPERTFYDSKENLVFQNALVTLMSRAYETSFQKDRTKGSTSDKATCYDEFNIGEQRMGYSFYADQADGAVVVESVIFMKVDEMSDRAIRQIHDTIQNLSTISDEIKARFNDNLHEIRKASIETFMRRTFYLTVGSERDIQLDTEIGYSVDTIEVDVMTTAIDGIIENGIFNEDDISEITRVLWLLKLADGDTLQEFVNQVD